MSDRAQRFPDHMQKGSDRVRSFFSLFGLRSARMERKRDGRERSESGDQDDAE